MRNVVIRLIQTIAIVIFVSTIFAKGFAAAMAYTDEKHVAKVQDIGLAATVEYPAHSERLDKICQKICDFAHRNFVGGLRCVKYVGLLIIDLFSSTVKFLLVKEIGEYLYAYRGLILGMIELLKTWFED